MILALNCGSSSVKYQLYAWKKHKVLAKGVVERVGHGRSYILHERPDQGIIKKEKPCPDYRLAIKFILETLTDDEIGILHDVQGIRAVGHRVVHGGDIFSHSVLIDDEVLATIRNVQDLAPLHNPPNIAGIESAKQVMPDIPQVAVFDTAFHQTIPEVAYMYAVPQEWYQEFGVRRYGFHGTSHLYVSKRARKYIDKPLEETRIITLHIGNGVSITAVKGGISVDTSMGFTPLEGAVMGTRSGDLDPAIIPYIAQKLNIPSSEVVNILNKKSGLLGLTGQYTDRRDIRQAARDGDNRAQLAIDIEAYRLRKYIGAYAAAMSGVDAVVFTAGVGENSPLMRAKAASGLEYMGICLDQQLNEQAVGGKAEMVISVADAAVKVLVIPTNEELVFIEDVVAIMENRYDVHTKYTYSFQA